MFYSKFVPSRRRLSTFAIGALAAMWLATSWATDEKSVQAQPGTTGKARSAPAVSVTLAENGRALFPVVISTAASTQEKAVAQTLATYLKRISGSEFKVETASSAFTNATPGIVLGTTARFTSIVADFKAGDPKGTEDYLLRSHATGVLLVGATELALEHAVWDFLYRLGHRQFFAGAKWEVIPSEKNLSVAVNVFEHPDYYTRRLAPGYGILKENRADYDAWEARNRMGTGISLRTSHAYGKIIQANKAEFEKHPEYLTKPGGDKFCVSNPGLQQLVVNYALKTFDANPALQSLSLDPSDGGNWESDSCPDATVYKSVTDRVITLANIVAEAVAKKHPGKFIGIYAYNEHSPPPTIKVHPNVIPSIATAFIRGGYSHAQLMKGWSEKASQVGIREYYGVYPWDFDLPGRPHAAKLKYISNTITKFHDEKARFMIAENSVNWGPSGLGYYMASRLLWDTGEVARVEEIRADFLQKAFGTAQEPMAEFYRIIDGSNKPLLSADLVGRLYRQLNKALKSTTDPAVTARLHDLALYVRYVELYLTMTQKNGEAHRVACEDVMRFVWQIRRTGMVHTLGVWSDLARYQNIKISSEAKDALKNNDPITSQQIEKFISEGIANNEILDFQVVSFSNELIPATPLGLKTTRPGTFKFIRNRQILYTWVKKQPATITLKASAGHSFKDRGDTKFELYPVDEPEAKSVAETSVAPDQVTREVQLHTNFRGLHRVSISDGRATTALFWDGGLPVTVESSLEAPTAFSGGAWTMYFYVPKGTKIVGGYRSGSGRLLNSDGKPALTFGPENTPGYWSVPVAAGQDGKLWQLAGIKGNVALMTVPPYLARSASELLLPKEVVAVDGAQ